MNGYQRIQAALNGEMPDQRPVMLHNFMMAVREAGYTQKQYREDPQIAAKCLIQSVEKYGLDGVLFDVDTALTAGAVGVPVDFPDDDPARTHDIFLESLEDVDSLAEVDLSKNIRVQHAIETVRILKKYFNNQVFVRGNCDQAPFSLACSMRTPANFMMDLMIDEENSIKLLNYCSGIGRQLIRLMIQAGSDLVSNGDSPAGPAMISPEMYQVFAHPYEKELVDEAHAQNIPYLLHICGNTDVILDQMATLGLDAVELDYLTSIEKIYGYFSQKTALFGTIDPSGILNFGTPADVKAKSMELFNLYKGNPRFVIGAGCAIPPNAPPANIHAIVSAAKATSLY